MAKPRKARPPQSKMEEAVDELLFDRDNINGFLDSMLSKMEILQQICWQVEETQRDNRELKAWLEVPKSQKPECVAPDAAPSLRIAQPVEIDTWAAEEEERKF